MIKEFWLENIWKIELPLNIEKASWSRMAKQYILVLAMNPYETQQFHE